MSVWCVLLSHLCAKIESVLVFACAKGGSGAADGCVARGANKWREGVTELEQMRLHFQDYSWSCCFVATLRGSARHAELDIKTFLFAS